MQKTVCAKCRRRLQGPKNCREVRELLCPQCFEELTGVRLETREELAELWRDCGGESG